MAKKPKQQPDEENEVVPLSVEGLTDKALNAFSQKARADIPREEVRAVVVSLDLAKLQPSRKVPRLQVRRLKFIGTKVLDGTESPIKYDQAFQSGVNAVVIEDNLVGKSSILKTIKFALTGNYSEYDEDVFGWITDVWLQFSLDDKKFTILLGWREDVLHGRLAPGEHDCPLEKVPRASASKGFYHQGEEEVQKAIGAFFVREFELASLGWNQTHPTKGKDAIEVWATWLTYFQALRILDDNHTYLLCKPEYANQDQLLFSAFLGLHLSEPLNQLGMQASAIKKRKEANEEAAGEAEEKRKALIARRTKLKADLDALDADQARRLEAITGGDLAANLVTAQGELVEADTEVTAIDEQVQNLTNQAQQSVANARRLREQIDLTNELTGLDVSICPSCARGIDPAAKAREKTVHECRLCVRPVPTAGDDQSALLEAAAADFDKRATDLKGRLPQARRELEAAKQKAESLRSKVATIRSTISEGVAKGLPTQAENVRRGQLHEEVGAINYEVRSLEQAGAGGAGENHDLKLKIIEKVQQVLKVEADTRNKDIESRLNELAAEVIKALRADQIDGIKCYPSGVVKLTKDGSPIAFSRLMNPGGRYRAKLALFLAMMRLGCEAGVGRHPGFLLLDQLGTAELVPADLAASAQALKQIEDEYGERVQIICFTAKPEFRKATVATKVYGPSLTPAKGKKWAF